MSQRTNSRRRAKVEPIRIEELTDAGNFGGFDALFRTAPEEYGLPGLPDQKPAADPKTIPPRVDIKSLENSIEAAISTGKVDPGRIQRATRATEQLAAINRQLKETAEVLLSPEAKAPGAKEALYLKIAGIMADPEVEKARGIDQEPIPSPAAAGSETRCSARGRSVS
jgi:hypothetical protein